MDANVAHFTAVGGFSVVLFLLSRFFCFSFFLFSLTYWAMHAGHRRKGHPCIATSCEHHCGREVGRKHPPLEWSTDAGPHLGVGSGRLPCFGTRWGTCQEMHTVENGPRKYFHDMCSPALFGVSRSSSVFAAL